MIRLTLLALVVTGLVLGQGVRPWGSEPAQAKAAPKQQSVATAPSMSAPQPFTNLPWLKSEAQWNGQDDNLPAVLDQIPVQELDRALNEIARVKALADAVFTTKVHYWQTQVDRIAAEERRDGEFILDIPRQQKEMDALGKLSQEEVADLDQRSARLQTSLAGVDVNPANAQQRIDRIREVAQEQITAIKQHRTQLDERLKNLAAAIEFFKQLRQVMEQYRVSASIEAGLWSSHYDGLGALRQQLYARWLITNVPEVQGQNCLGSIKLPGAKTSCVPATQNKNK